MKIRKFTAVNTQEAIAKVKNELGGEALIINTKKVRQKGLFGYFKKPLFEVTAAIDEQSQLKAKRLAVGVRDYYEKNPQAGAPKDVFAQFQSQLKNTGVLPGVQARKTQGQNPVYAGDQISAQVYSETAAPETTTVQARSAREAPGFRAQPAQAPRDEATAALTLENRIVSMEKTLTKVYREVSIASKMIETDGEKLAPLSKVLRYYYDNLIKNEVEPEFSMKLIEKVSERLQSGEEGRDAAAAFRAELLAVLGTSETIRVNRGEKPAIVIFVGPTGVGKTTTLAKIAADSALNKELDVAMITADTYRIAAVRQLTTYAEILGVPISVAYTPGEIKSCVAAYSDKDLILIDTAGRSHKNRVQFDELRELVELSGADEVFLVLSMTASAKNYRDIIEHYNFLDRYKLIFTKADEAPAFGSILNARMLTGKQLSYITVGQNVPDDIEIANVNKIVGKLMA